MSQSHTCEPANFFALSARGAQRHRAGRARRVTYHCRQLFRCVVTWIRSSGVRRFSLFGSPGVRTASATAYRTTRPYSDYGLKAVP
eukprot:1654548-Prymnesium_polylepis.1